MAGYAHLAFVSWRNTPDLGVQQTVVGRGLPTRAAYGCGPFCLAEAPAVSRIPSKSATPGTCTLSQPVQVLSVNNPRSDAGLIRHPRAFVPRAVTALIGPSTVLGCWGVLGVARRLLGLPEHLVSRGRSSGRSRRREHGLNRTSCCCPQGTPPSLGFCSYRLAIRNRESAC
jgi:hypothetical protein